ncbi:MAG: hypothetical protein AAF761_04330 [Pseudomonadota bacterium]
MLRTIAIAILGAALGGAVAAEDAKPDRTVWLSMAATEDCHRADGDEANCVRFIGCYGSDGDWFEGTSRGWNEGRMQVRSFAGQRCSGRFDYRPMLDMGRAQIVCNGGEAAQITFFSRGGDTDVVSGHGITDQGTRIVFYSGTMLAAFLRTRSDTGNTNMIACGPTKLVIAD